MFHFPAPAVFGSLLARYVLEFQTTAVRETRHFAPRLFGGVERLCLVVPSRRKVPRTFARRMRG
jgi:hypothetical protein